MPSLSALHDVVPLDVVVEFVIDVVLPTLVELVTLVELLELTELVTLVELLASIELVAAPADMTSSAEPHAHNPSAITVTRYRYLIVVCSMLSP